MTSDSCQWPSPWARARVTLGWTRLPPWLVLLLLIFHPQSTASTVRTPTETTVRTQTETVVTTVAVDVAGSNREWFAIALCRITCLDTSAILKLKTQEQTTKTLPRCVLDTSYTCGSAINLTATPSDGGGGHNIPCSSADKSSSASCGGMKSEAVTDYDKCVQLCQNIEIQKSCVSPCSSHQFLLSNANLNETSQQTWVTVIVPLSPPIQCKNESSVVDEDDDEEDAEDFDEDAFEMRGNERKKREKDEEEIDCDLEGGVWIKEVWDSKGAEVKWADAPIQHCPALYDVDGAKGHVVYIVQMRQLLRLQPNLVADEWKTITVTTQNATSLKYVLTLGLHYQVRIIAMSAKGICSATEESRPFGLPRGHPSPGPPRNLRYTEYNRSQGGVLGNTIHWDPPTFTIPISHYLITWFSHDARNHIQPAQHHTGAVTRLRHQLHSSRHAPLHPHVAVPGKKRAYCIRNFLNDHIYVVKIQAVARLGETDIFGEPASLKIHTFSLATRTTGLSTVPPPSTTTLGQFNANIISLNITRIFFENGILQAILQWNYTQDVNQKIEQFIIRVHSQLCPAIFQLDHSPKKEYVHQYVTKPPVSTIKIQDLRFDCIYQVNVVAVSARGVQGTEIMTTLETPLCHRVEVEGDVGPDCPPSAPHHFLCNMDRVTRAMAATCQWTYRHAHSNPTSLRGFLIVANTHQSPHRHGGSLKNSSTHMLVNKDARRVVLTELVPNTKYHVTIRVVGINGLGPNAHAHFFASSPPYYHGTQHSVTFQAWRSSSRRTECNASVIVLNFVIISFIFQMWFKTHHRIS